MELEYTKENPLPKEVYNRMRRNSRRRIARRKKAQLETETVEQFEQIVFDTIKSKVAELSHSKISNLKTVIKDRVKNFILAENDKSIEEAKNLKRLFAEYGLTKQQLIETVRQTRWAKLQDEILELEIMQGVEAIHAGYYITLESKEDFRAFFEDIKRRAVQKIKARRTNKK